MACEGGEISTPYDKNLQVAHVGALSNATSPKKDSNNFALQRETDDAMAFWSMLFKFSLTVGPPEIYCTSLALFECS